MAAEPRAQRVQDVADGVQKQIGWLAAGILVMNPHARPSPSCRAVLQIAFALFFFLSICKCKPANLLDKISVS